MSHDSVCNSSSSRLHLGSGTCGRSIVGLLIPIYVSKLLYSVIFAVLPVIWSYLSPRARDLAQDRFPRGLAVFDSAMSRIGMKKESEGVEPDPMDALSFMEPALVLGSTCPLLVLLLGIQLGASAYAHEYLVSDAPSSKGEGPPKEFVREPIRVLATLISAMQVAWCALFLYDSGFAGWYLVLLASPGPVLLHVFAHVLERNRDHDSTG